LPQEDMKDIIKRNGGVVTPGNVTGKTAGVLSFLAANVFFA
jgi:hypothetical protein